MALYAVAYPDLAEADAAWIKDYRMQHDPLFRDIIDAHVTLVFGIGDIAEDAFVAEVGRVCATQPPIDFTVSAATLNHDNSETYFHQFLVMDHGNGAIIRLHDDLYKGLFADHLRHDIDYIPHIGIGTGDDPEAIQSRCHDLNATPVAITGRLSALTVIDVEDRIVSQVATLPLTGS